MTRAEARAVLEDELFIAGTGMPDQSTKLVRNVLRALNYKSMTGDHERWYRWLTKLLPTSALYYFMLYQLDRCGLVESGFSVGSMGLSDKGKALLAVFDGLHGQIYLMDSDYECNEETGELELI